MTIIDAISPNDVLQIWARMIRSFLSLANMQAFKRIREIMWANAKELRIICKQCCNSKRYDSLSFDAFPGLERCEVRVDARMVHHLASDSALLVAAAVRQGKARAIVLRSRSSRSMTQANCRAAVAMCVEMRCDCCYGWFWGALKWWLVSFMSWGALKSNDDSCHTCFAIVAMKCNSQLVSRYKTYWKYVTRYTGVRCHETAAVSSAKGGTLYFIPHSINRFVFETFIVISRL
jgi:hypothetical protein